MSAGPLVVTYPMTGRSRAIVTEELGGVAEVIYLAELAPAERAAALSRAGAVLANDTAKELLPGEAALLANARLLQFSAAGVDWVPTRDLPPELPVAGSETAKKLIDETRPSNTLMKRWAESVPKTAG